MKQFFVLIFCFLFAKAVNASEPPVGTWERNDGERIDIIDGFKPNIGPVILYDKGEVSRVATWRINVNDGTLSIGYTTRPFATSKDSATLQWGSTTWRKKRDFEQTGVLSLKSDPHAFVDEMTGYAWNLNSSKAGRYEFTRTFSTTEGVVSLIDGAGTIKSLGAWGVASGTLKFGSLYIEARITPEYLVAVDDDDDFIVLNRGKERESISKTSMRESREEFLKAMTTGSWKRPSSFGGDHVYRFRPIEGPLKGRRFWERDGQLEGTSVWEFSPATGALKIGSTKYIGAMTLNDLLVFIEEDGDQRAHARDPSEKHKPFTVSDAKSIGVSERTVPEIKSVVARQLSYEDQFTLFEFGRDGRTGYVHEWKSYPFQITGQSLKTEGWGSYEQIHVVDGYVVFGDGKGRKIDVRESRLRPKTDNESQLDVVKAKQQLAELQHVNLKLKLILVDGSVQTIPLSVKSFAEVRSVMLVDE